MKRNKKLSIAFVVGSFPSVSETFIIDQIYDLESSGVDVKVFSFRRPLNRNGISDKFFKLKAPVHYLEMPENKIPRFLSAIPKIINICLKRPGLLRGIFNFKKYGSDARSLKLLYWAEPFVGKKFDLAHCHFGPMANKYLKIRGVLGVSQPIITTFYGYDVSNIVKQKGAGVYDRLKEEGSLFFVMSNNMKERVVALGFDPKKIIVHPVGINPMEYEFKERSVSANEDVNIISVGRFVEKKGFDDLLRALAIVKQNSKRSFKCTVVGGGPLEKELQELTDDLNVRDVLDYKGYMKIGDVVRLFKGMNFFVQPSKTAKNGDME